MPSLPRLPADALTAVDLAGAAAYLRATGWEETGRYHRAVVWTAAVDGGRAEVLLPTRSGVGDYATRMADMIGTLSSVERRPEPEILRDLQSTSVDVQLVRTMPDTPPGTTPLHEGFLAVKGVRDLYLAAATSALSDQRPIVLPGKRPPDAHSFLDRTRLGQPGQGSYVLRVETPLPEPGLQPLVSSRDVLLHLYQATNAAHEAAQAARENSLSEFTERVGDGVSANLCDALADIGGARRSPFELRFAWAPTAPVGLPTPPLAFDRDTITTLKSAVRYLRELPTAERATVIGNVVNLHRTPMDKLGKVQVEGEVQEPDQTRAGQRVVLRLPADAYERVVAAHGAGRRVRLVGALRHTGRRFEMSEVTEIEILDV